MRDWDVLCVGNAAWDVVLQVDRHPGPDDKVEAVERLTCGGGPAANAAVGCARLGLRAAFAGYLSGDVFGTLHRAELENEGVDLSFVSTGNAPMRVSTCLLYTSPSPRDRTRSRMPSSA